MCKSPRHIGIAVVTVLLSLSTASAQVMQSTSYRIESDSINIGGSFSSSTSYKLEDTIGEVATGFSSSTSYNLSAGYQALQAAYLALSGATNVTLSPTLGGVTGGESNGSTTVIATTDSSGGYQLTIAASTSPAMKFGANTIADYVPAGANPDYIFSTVASESHLGFSPEGTDIATRFKDDGIGCNTGSGDTNFACWDGLSTVAQTIVYRSSANTPTGTLTQIRFRVGIGGSVSQAPGTYTATTTITALAL